MNFQDPGVITTALTAGGAVIWAYAIQFVIQVVKAVPQFRAVLDGREKLACFLLAFLVVALAFTVAVQAVPPTASLDIIGIVGMILAGFNIARVAMAAYDDFLARAGEPPKVAADARPRQSVLSPIGWVGKPNPQPDPQ